MKLLAAFVLMQIVSLNAFATIPFESVIRARSVYKCTDGTVLRTTTFDGNSLSVEINGQQAKSSNGGLHSFIINDTAFGQEYSNDPTKDPNFAGVIMSADYGGAGWEAAIISTGQRGHFKLRGSGATISSLTTCDETSSQSLGD